MLSKGRIIITHYLIFDCETGGLDSTKNPLLSIAGLIVNKEYEIKDSFHYYLKPDLENYPVVTEQALKVNGLNIAELQENGYTGVAVASALCLHYETHRTAKEKFTLVGWNVRFDRGFLDQIIKTELIAHRRDMDLTSVAMFLLPELKSYSLDAVCEYYGLKRESKIHNALEDVHLTFEVFKRLKEE